MFDLEGYLAESGVSVEKDVCLAPYTSFHIGGNCRFLVRPSNGLEVQLALEGARQAGIAFEFLGNGSNVLVSDSGYDGMVLLSEGLSTISCMKLETKSELYLLGAGSGASIAKLCGAALEQGLSGLEFAWGIPGSVGGAVYMNAGAYGGEIKDTLYDCTFLDEAGEEQTLFCGQMDFSYRHSIFTNRKCFILQARFALPKDDSVAIKARMDDYLFRRKSKQPLEFPSAGSIFKRPKNGYASAMIEACGLKGRSIGGAQVSEKHSGFIINTGGATCQDVLELIELVRETVCMKMGCLLECEVKRLGN